MESPLKTRPSSPKPATSSTSNSKLRYPLRSATKRNKDEIKLSERETRLPNVSKSVNVLDLSGKEKAQKPPRRLSNPVNTPATATPAARPAGRSLTPMPEFRVVNKLRRSQLGSGASTPTSDASKSLSFTRRKFNMLSSASYWLNQIKLSEADLKHNISLGFFKLALEAGCEPLQKMKDELKMYAHRYHILDLGEPVKDVLRDYGILEDIEQFPCSDSSSLVPENDDDSEKASFDSLSNNKPKPLKADYTTPQQRKEVKKERIQKSNNSAAAASTGTPYPHTSFSTINSNKNTRRTTGKQESEVAGKGKIRKSAEENVKTDSVTILNAEKHEDKENMECEELDNSGVTVQT